MNRSATDPFVPANELASELTTDPSSRHIQSTARMHMEEASSRPKRRRASLLDAASALASLGGAARTSYADEGGAGAMPAAWREEMEHRRGYRGEDLPMTFPEKLMDMLSNRAVSDIVTWLPHGKGFVILQKRKFAEEVLPLYFNKRTKFTSFTRKLSRWGFARVATGPDIGTYYHKNFQRGNHLLSFQMHCTSKPPPKTETASKKRSTPDNQSRKSSPSSQTEVGSVNGHEGSYAEFREVIRRQRQHLPLHLRAPERARRCSYYDRERSGDSVDLFCSQARQRLERGAFRNPSSTQRTLRDSELELGRLEFASEEVKSRFSGHGVPPKKRHHEYSATLPSYESYERSLPPSHGRERCHISAPTRGHSVAPPYSSGRDNLQQDLHSFMRARLAGIHKSNKRTEDALNKDWQTAPRNGPVKRRVYSTSPPTMGLLSYKKNARRASAA